MVFVARLEDKRPEGALGTGKGLCGRTHLEMHVQIQTFTIPRDLPPYRFPRDRL